MLEQAALAINDPATLADSSPCSCRVGEPVPSSVEGPRLIREPPHLRSTFRAPRPQELDVSPVVMVTQQGLLAAAAPWREVMGQPCCHRSGDSGHDQVLAGC
jgi:hypothetical protein